MAKLTKKKLEKLVLLTLEEAVENLSVIAEMRVDEKTPIGILQNTKLTTKEEDFSYKEIQWLFPEDAIGFLEHIKPSYIALLEHLKELSINPTIEWEDPAFKNGLQSIMALAAEAANKLNRYFALFHKKIDVTQIEEFKNLQHFYLEDISQKYSHKLEGKEEWEEQWQENKEKEVLDFDKSSIKDFSSIEEDLNYELFYLKNIDGEVLFSPHLLRNLKLYKYFDEAVDVTDDLFLKIKKLNNKDLQLSSKQILNSLDKEIHQFYKYHFNCKTNKLAGLLNKSFIALMITANPQTLAKEEDQGKSCYQFFKDFQLFLRDGFLSDEYQKTLGLKKTKKDEKASFLLKLLNKLSYALFTRLGGVKQETIGYIYRITRQGKEKEKLPKNSSFWNFLMEKDDNFRSFLKKYPNGPLMKIIEMIEEKDEKELLFDPLMQGNIPLKLFEMEAIFGKVFILHLPCPTKQKIINQAEVAEEFLGFLRECKRNKIKHLLFNLQDSLSWRENTRVKTMEILQKQPEFEKNLTVVTLSKDSNFYNQTEEFLFLTKAEDFVKALKKELFSAEDKGFFLPISLQTKEILHFVDEVCLLIHNTFFLEKKELSKDERKNFIEIFYQLLILKIIELEKPVSLSFTCKDGVDVGGSTSASFFCFIKFLSKPQWPKEDVDFLLWLLYSSSLLIRQRAIHSERLIRQFSCLALLEAHQKGLKKALKKLYKSNFLDSLLINHFH